MYVRIINSVIANRDQNWPLESQDYVDLMESYKQQGKLLTRVVTQNDPYEAESTWIFDSRESYLQWKDEPANIERNNLIKDYTTTTLVSEEEI